MKSERTMVKHTPSYLHSLLRRATTSVCISEIANCCAEMFYTLEQRIFHALEFHRLNHSIVETMRCFQRKFNVTKGLKWDITDDLFEIFQQTGNDNDDHVGNTGTLWKPVTDANVKVFQQVDWQWPQLPVQCVAAQTWLRRMSTHRIIRNNLQLFPYSFRLDNSLVLLPLMNVRRSWALCCSSCMLANRCGKHLVL